MIFQQAVLFPSWEVFAVGGAAMALGLLSYYIAGARTAESYRTGDAAGAEQLATEAGMLGETDPSAGAVVSSEQHAATDVFAAPADAPAEVPPDVSIMKRLERRFTESLRKAQVRAQPVIEKLGVRGMFRLYFGPTPLGTTAAFVGGLMRFGFARYLATSFAAKYPLAGIIVAMGLVFSDAARAVDLPF